MPDPASIRALYDATPPANPDAERAVLSICLQSEDACRIACDTLGVPDMYAVQHAHIFEAVSALTAQHVRADWQSVVNELIRQERLDLVGGRQAIFSLSMHTAPAADTFAYFLREVERTANLRRMWEAGIEVQRIALSDPEDATEAHAAAEAVLRAAGGDKGDCESRDLGAVAADVLAQAQERAEGTRTLGASTGFGRLNWFLGGLEPGTLYLLAGRPSMGKSALAGQIAWTVALSGRPVLVASLEMSPEQWTQRIICSEARVPLQSYRLAKLEPSDWAKVAQLTRRMKQMPIRLLCKGALTPAGVRREARRLHRTRGLGLIVVDYIGLMPAPAGRRGDNRVLYLREYADELKGIGQELGCPVLVLSQLSRRVEERPKHMPQLSDLYESGGLEASADAVLMIHWPDYYDAREASREPVEPAQLSLIVAKQRMGPIGSVDLVFWPSLGRFAGLSKDEPQEAPDAFADD